MKSHKQSLIASSTMEAKYVACYEATCHAIWLRKFVSGLHVIDLIMKPLRIYCDNNAVVRFTKNNKTTGGLKHIDTKYLVVREKVQNEVVSIKHIKNTLLLADPLTKGFLPKLFMDYVACMGLVASLSILNYI